MTLSKKSYKTHQLLIKKHPGIPQPSLEPTQDFKQGSKMSSSNGILWIHSHVSKFHGNNLEFPRNEEGMLPSPSEPPEVSQPSASNNEKAAAQNEAAITLRGAFRYLKKWFWVRWVQCIMIWLYKNTLMHTTLRTLQGSGTGVKITVHSLGGDKHRDWKVLLKIQLKKKANILWKKYSICNYWCSHLMGCWCKSNQERCTHIYKNQNRQVSPSRLEKTPKYMAYLTNKRELSFTQAFHNALHEIFFPFKRTTGIK